MEITPPSSEQSRADQASAAASQNYAAGAKVGPVTVAATGPDPWTVFWMGAGLIATTGIVVAAVRHSAAEDRRRAARERRHDQLDARLAKMRMRAALARRPRG